MEEKGEPKRGVEPASLPSAQLPAERALPPGQAGSQYMGDGRTKTKYTGDGRARELEPREFVTMFTAGVVLHSVAVKYGSSD